MSKAVQCSVHSTGHVLYSFTHNFTTLYKQHFSSLVTTAQGTRHSGHFIFFCEIVMALLQLANIKCYFKNFVILLGKMEEVLCRGIKIYLYPGDLTGNTLHILKIYFTFQIISSRRWNFLFHIEIR